MKVFKSYKNTLLFLFVIIGILPLIIFSFYSFVHTYKETQRKTESYMQSNLQIAADLVENNLQMFSDIVTYLSTDIDVVNILAKDTHTNANRDFTDTQTLYKVNQVVSAGLPIKVPIHYINNRHQSRYSSTDYYDPMYLGRRGDFYSLMDKKIDVVHYIKRRVDGEESLDISFSIGRAVRNPDDDSVILGYIVIDIYDNYFQDIIDSVAMEESSNIFLLDNKNIIITDRKYKNLTGFTFFGNSTIPDDGTKMINNAIQRNNIIVDSQNYIGYYMQTSVLGISILEIVPSSFYWEQSLQQVKPLLLFVMLSIVSLILLMRQLAAYIYKPIHMLSNAMQEVEEGNFDVKVDLDIDNEIGFLGNSFNKMVSKINKLIENDYKNQIIIQNSKLTILKAQIKPHFLYNCMNLISMMANLGENEKAAKMAVLLSDYYRYNMSNLDSLVTVRQELKHAEGYLEIQKIRYVEKLAYDISADECIFDIKMPSQLLQPIVENAIEHGIEKRQENGIIKIEAKKCENNIEICVRDNGYGFDKCFEESKDVGLTNTDQRIKYYYGNSYGVSMVRQDEFTKVCIKFPFKKEGDNNL